MSSEAAPECRCAAARVPSDLDRLGELLRLDVVDVVRGQRPPTWAVVLTDGRVISLGTDERVEAPKYLRRVLVSAGGRTQVPPKVAREVAALLRLIHREQGEQA